LPNKTIICIRNSFKFFLQNLKITPCIKLIYTLKPSFQKLSNTYYLTEYITLISPKPYKASYHFGGMRLYAFTGFIIMTLQCPQCHSFQINTLNHGRKTGSTVGTVAGAASGASSSLTGARIGASVGAVAGPLGSVVGGFAGALFGGFIGGVAGGTAGSKLGEFVDDNILDNYQCLRCGYTFSKPCE
jgi:hypothetical protein